jgi:hypothetical protein
VDTQVRWKNEHGYNLSFNRDDSMDWFRGKLKQETIDFPIKYGVFL